MFLKANVQDSDVLLLTGATLTLVSTVLTEKITEKTIRTLGPLPKNMHDSREKKTRCTVSGKGKLIHMESW
jgi:hypothetical protein